MDQEAQPGRRPSMREWLGAWLDDGADVPEVGRGGGRVLAGTTGELAACLQHIAGCPSCKARWPRAGYVAMQLGDGDHVAFTVDVEPAEPEPTRPEGTPEVEPKDSRSESRSKWAEAHLEWGDTIWVAERRNPSQAEEAAFRAGFDAGVWGRL